LRMGTSLLLRFDLRRSSSFVSSDVTTGFSTPPISHTLPVTMPLKGLRHLPC
jgi:hypothetical protein